MESGPWESFEVLILDEMELEFRLSLSALGTSKIGSVPGNPILQFSITYEPMPLFACGGRLSFLFLLE